MSEYKADRCSRCIPNEGISSLFYERLPGPVRDLLHPFVRSVYMKLHGICCIASDVYKPVRLIGRDDVPGLTLLEAGKGEASSFFLGRLFPGDSKAATQSRHFIWEIASMDRPEADAVLIEADRCFSRFLCRRGFFAIPEWILFTLDISRPLGEIFKRYARIEYSNLQKIRKHRYEWEVVCDRDSLRFFYERMYVPYTAARFGKSAMLVSMAFLETILPKGKLLLVKKSGEYVSGCFIYTAGSRPEVYFQGIRDGSPEFLKEGAVTALYYYTIVWAKESGYAEVDFGHCRPLLNDGVFLYKKRWGMRIHKNPKKRRMLYFSIRRLTPQVRKFLLNNPFLYEASGQLRGLVFAQGNDPVSKPEREVLEKKFFIPGLNRITVVSVDGSNSEIFSTG